MTWRSRAWRPLRTGWPARSASSPSSGRSRVGDPGNAGVVMKDVTGVTTLELADGSATDLVNQLNEVAGQVSLLLVVILLHAKDKAR